MLNLNREKGCSRMHPSAFLSVHVAQKSTVHLILRPEGGTPATKHAIYLQQPFSFYSEICRESLKESTHIASLI